MSIAKPVWKTLSLTHPQPGVLQVEISRPDIRNAFNETMIDELHAVFASTALDPSVKVVVFRGAGPAFSAGGDLSWMKKSVEKTVDQNLEETTRLTAMFKVMNEFPKPLIGAVHGAAIGGGVGLVSVCDIVIATEDTQFSLAEVRLGIVPACIGPFVIAKIGASHARGLFVSAERFTAAKALQIGLVHEVVKDAAAQQEAVNRVVGNILQCGPNAMAIAKQLVLDLSWPERREKIKDPYHYVSKTLAEIRVTPEGQEGLRAFLEKRKPSWMVSRE